MLALVVILLIVWLVAAVAGFVVKGLLWLGLLGVCLFLITALVGALRSRKR